MDTSTAADTPFTSDEIEELTALLPYGDSMEGLSIEGNARKVSAVLMLAGSVRGLLALMKQKDLAHRQREAELLALLKSEARLILDPSQSGTAPQSGTCT